jgi:hypothetical protein
MVLGLAAPSLSEPANFDATFSLSLGSFPPFTAPATGSLDATIEGGVVTAFTLPADVFDLQKATDLPTPIEVIKGVVLTSVTVNAKNAKGQFDQKFGLGPFLGESKLLFNGKGTLTATIPLDKGVGTTHQIKASLFGLVDLTIDAEKWRVGTATATTIPLGGGAEQKITKKGAFDGTSKFTFVAPTQITIAVPGDPSLIAAFGQLDIEIEAPEAANVLLLATGAAVLLLVGYRRSAA